MTRTLFLTIQFVLLLAIGWGAYGTYLRWTSPTPDAKEAESGEDSKSEPSMNSETESQRSINGYRFIAKRNLFKIGTSDPEASTIQDLSHLKKTELKLKLWGTVTGLDGLTRAVIESLSDRQQMIFKESDTIESAQIKQILRDKVVLTVDGEDQILEVEDVPLLNGRKSTLRRSKAIAQNNPSNGQPPQSGTSSSLTETKLPFQTLDASLLSELKDSDTPETPSVVAVPYRGQNDVTGLLLTQLAPNSIFHQMGMRNGDILVKFDKVSPAAIGDAIDALKGLSIGDEFSFEIYRRGKPVAMAFSFK